MEVVKDQEIRNLSWQRSLRIRIELSLKNSLSMGNRQSTNYLHLLTVWLKIVQTILSFSFLKQEATLFPELRDSV